jgi:hypothetical protein
VVACTGSTGGRDRSGLLESLGRRFVAVRAALDLFPGAADVPVRTVLCFLDAMPPMFGTPKIGGVPLLGPRRAARLCPPPVRTTPTPVPRRTPTLPPSSPRRHDGGSYRLGASAG